MISNKNVVPLEIIDLPSKGWFYDSKSPLSNGTIEISPLLGMHEDILLSANFIRRGVVIDKLLEAIIGNSEVKYDDILLGDKIAIMVACRISGYGKTYEVQVECPQCSTKSNQEIDLETFKFKEIDFDLFIKGQNEFKFQLPFTKKTITFKLLTRKDEREIAVEIEAMRKAFKNEGSKEVTTRMRYSILSIDGDTDRKTINDFVNFIPARDAMAFREYAKSINPDVEMSFDFVCQKCGHSVGMEVPIDVTFFWPNARV